jgi:hypothetical protein
MDPIRIFISYRRDDSAGYARAIGAELVREFGPEHVFIDVDDIGAGQLFAEVIRSAVGQSNVLLVLIGKRWFGERGGAAAARLFDADDFVRLEVAAGLAQGLRVIPVLLDGTTMPAAAQLPADLQALAERHAVELGNSRYVSDLAHLVAVLGAAPGAPTVARDAAAPRGPGRAAAVAFGASAVALAVLAWWVLAGGGSATRLPAVAAAPAGPPSIDQPPVGVRPAVDGAWQAEVEYDWPNARYTERFDFEGAGEALHGSASFLRVPRGVLEGRVLRQGLAFVTRTRDLSGGVETTRRYRAQLVDGTLVFTMQAEGGGEPHVPVKFVARRVAAQPAVAR